ncbi:DUF998 domain-containing protein [Mycolicibacterium stellerae]|uniref:DUF998 domain-containing protein n=1 Tax=Mycolicibacterium stellerae TaxID=2358193 RepID=UPI000F0B554D|nr:DUF998 domain-containing protein [Mycolicibacterium stellerae]
MTAATTCPPLADRVTKSLLGYGVIAGPLYVASVAAQVATREGFDPTRHAASQLANGDLGWVQIVTFLVTGAMTIAAAVGVRRALGAGRSSAWAAGLLGAYGAGLVAAGIFRADPSDGFPPGTPPGMAEPTWHAMVHLTVAGVAFIALVASCFVFAACFSRAGEGGWAWFSRVTGLVFAGTFAFMASGAGAVAILSFTAAVVLAWAWMTAISIKLYKGVGM